MKEQKELKAMYAEQLIDVYHGDKRMIDYCKGKADYLVELDDGCIIALEKPDIKKHFCFGYSLSREDSESYDAANEAAADAEKNIGHFIAENMKELDHRLKTLRDSGRFAFYVQDAFYSQSPDNKIRCLITQDKWEQEHLGLREISARELQALIDGYEVVKGNFLKRLNIYLKKYGLSKIQTWSYWRDE